MILVSLQGETPLGFRGLVLFIGLIQSLFVLILIS